MCIRCHEADAPEPLGYCTTCAMQAKIEVTDGYRRFQRYLAAWAAFDDWLRRQGTGTSSV